MNKELLRAYVRRVGWDGLVANGVTVAIAVAVGVGMHGFRGWWLAWLLACVALLALGHWRAFSGARRDVAAAEARRQREAEVAQWNKDHPDRWLLRE